MNVTMNELFVLISTVHWIHLVYKEPTILFMLHRLFYMDSITFEFIINSVYLGFFLKRFNYFLFHESICCSSCNSCFAQWWVGCGAVVVFFFFFFFKTKSLQMSSFTSVPWKMILYHKFSDKCDPHKHEEVVKATTAFWKDALVLSPDWKGFWFSCQDVPPSSSSSSVRYSSSAASCLLTVMTRSLPGKKLVLQLLQTSSHPSQ